MNLIKKLINKWNTVPFIDFDNFYKNIKQNSKIAVKDVKMIERDLETFKSYPECEDYVENFDNTNDRIYDDIMYVTKSEGFAVTVASSLEYARWYSLIYCIGGEEYRTNECEMRKLILRFDKIYDLTLFSLLKYVALENDEVIFYEDGNIRYQQDSKFMSEILFLVQILQDIKSVQNAIAEADLMQVREMFKVFADHAYCEKHLKGANIFEL